MLADWTLSVGASMGLDFSEEKNTAAKVIKRQARENTKIEAHIKGCIWGIKKYL